MTQDEVNLIYDYLHHHCIYDHGELIRKISSYGQPVGRKIGIVILSQKHRNGKERAAKIMAKIKIDGKVYNKNLSLLVWIFHHKNYPSNLKMLDDNPLNTNIENMVVRDKKELYKTRILNPRINGCNKGITFIKDKNKFRAKTGLGGKSLFIGHFSDEEKAIEAVQYIRELYFNENLTPEELRKIIKDKYRIKSQTGFKNIIKSRCGKRFGYSFMVNGVFHRKLCFKSVDEALKACVKAKSELK